MDILYFRGVERLLIVSSGILCIVLGFLLFKQSYRLTTSTAGEMTAKAGGVELSLKNLWPGVFFAAFGMMILVMSMATRLEMLSPTNETNTYATRFQGGGLPPQDAKSRAIGAIGTIGELLLLESQKPDDIEAKRDRILTMLSTSQIDLIDVAYGIGSYAKFSDILSKSKTPSDYQKLSDADKQFFEDLRTVLQR